MSFSFRIISGYDAGRSFSLLNGESAVIGRHACDILLSDELISRRHASLEVVDNKIFLTDLGSSNGTYMDDAKVSPHDRLRVKDYFALGATIFRAVFPREPDFSEEAWPIISADLSAMNSLPFFQAALAAAKDEPLLHCGHLLYGLLEAHPELSDTLVKIGVPIDSQTLLVKLQHDKIFTGRHQWLNQSVASMKRIVQKSFLLITPKAGNKIASINDTDPDWPRKLLVRILEDYYNLGVIALNPPVTLTREDVVEKLADQAPDTIPELIPTSDDESAPRFKFSRKVWKPFQEACGHHPRILFTGEQGCGKSTLLKRHSLKTPSKHFDFRAYLYYTSRNRDLFQFLDTIKEALRGREVVILDHFDLLLNHGEAGHEVFEAVSSCRAPVILAVSRKNLGRVKRLCKNLETLDMNPLIGPELEICYQNQVSFFQSQIENQLSTAAYRYLMEKVVARDPYNLAALWDFLVLAREKLRAIGRIAFDSNSQTRAIGLLEEACFEDILIRTDQPTMMLNLTSDPNDSLGKGTDPAVSEAKQEVPTRDREDFGAATSDMPEDIQASSVLRDVESLMQQYGRDFFNVDMEYSDRSKSFDERSHSSRSEKLSELGNQLDLFFKVHQLGARLWLEGYLKSMDPEDIKQEIGSVRQFRQLWQTYCKRVEKMPPDLVLDNFNRSIGKLLEEGLYPPTQHLDTE